MARYLRAGRDDLNGVREDLLREFSCEALVAAIERPTSAAPIAPTAPSPRQEYRFRYEEGVPRAIAEGVPRLRTENQDSVLPLMQVICTRLYESKASDPSPERVISRADLEAIGGVKGGLQAFAEDAMRRSMGLDDADRGAFRALYAGLFNQQPDGTLTTFLKSRQSLEGSWKGGMPFAEVLDRAAQVRLLRVDELRIEGEKPSSYVRLGHERSPPWPPRGRPPSRPRRDAGRRGESGTPSSAGWRFRSC